MTTDRQAAYYPTTISRQAHAALILHRIHTNAQASLLLRGRLSLSELAAGVQIARNEAVSIVADHAVAAAAAGVHDPQLRQTLLTCCTSGEELEAVYTYALDRAGYVSDDPQLANVVHLLVEENPL